MKITLDWLGTATFRLNIDGLVIFLDAYIDRLPTAPPVGLTTAEVDRADFILVGHSHFDHLAGAEVIAARTGAKIIGSNESCRVMRECGVPAGQLLPSQGGERHRLSPDVTVRIFPSVHTCLFASASSDLGEPCTGDTGLTEDERSGAFAQGNTFSEAFAAHPDWAPQALAHMRDATGSRRDGGTLVYLIETPAGSIFWQDSTGCWTGVLRDLGADVAILAAVGRPNHNGEPYQGSTAQFVTMEASLLGAKAVILGHHDNWLGVPGRPAVPDMSAVRDALARSAPDARLLEPHYLDSTRLLS